MGAIEDAALAQAELQDQRLREEQRERRLQESERAASAALARAKAAEEELLKAKETIANYDQNRDQLTNGLHQQPTDQLTDQMNNMGPIESNLRQRERFANETLATANNMIESKYQ